MADIHACWSSTLRNMLNSSDNDIIHLWHADWQYFRLKLIPPIPKTQSKNWGGGGGVRVTGELDSAGSEAQSNHRICYQLPMSLDLHMYCYATTKNVLPLFNYNCNQT